MTGSYRKNFKM